LRKNEHKNAWHENIFFAAYWQVLKHSAQALTLFTQKRGCGVIALSLHFIPIIARMMAHIHEGQVNQCAIFS